MLSLNVTDDGLYTFSGRSINITQDKNKLLKPHGKQVQNYGIILSLLPTKEQSENFNQQIGNARFVRNDYLLKRMELYKKDKTTLSVSDYKKNFLSKLKEENPFLKLSDKFALEAAIEYVDIAYKNFFENLKKGKKTGFPKFASANKPNGNAYTTKYTNGNIVLLMENKLPYIKLPKVGKVRFILPIGKSISDILPFNTRITSATIKRYNNEYTISLQLESIVDIPVAIKEVKITDIISMDMGIKEFGIYGNMEYTNTIDNPRFIKNHEKRIKRLQKSLSRKKKGSKNYEKAKRKLAKEHKKVKNQRKDFHHKESRKIVNNCNVFVCEDLNIKGMVKNHRLAKEISSVGWGQFLIFVKYKLERKGGIFIKVDKFFASSKTCSKCGYKKEDLTLKDRSWICPKCNTIHDRDENAKNNLFNEGVILLTTEHNIKLVA